ncbi:synaptobrevin [Polychytrium aggregatum]|uniref:synaptobrevin n=1 Tax=Polychytrium aggregatum TaxID=110093 RepID=UPI0022FDE74B|nr:synaptobrevin [Polychytrium aggregatum]KAI9209085.1 synaptobrevin [Polychytrium aggregatum]
MSSSKTSQIQREVDQVVGIMQDNVTKVMERGEHLSTLQTKTDDLQNSSSQFRKGASAVRKQMWWKDMKMKIILGIIVAVILLAIILSVVLTKRN